MAKKKDIIRANDRVVILTPRVVTRVGYPKTVDDYLPRAEELIGKIVQEHCHAWTRHDVLRKMAYGLAKKDGFGGRDRTLHFQEQPVLSGRTGWVVDVKTAVTGIYRPGIRGYSGWDGYVEDEPPYLEIDRAWRLARVVVQTGQYQSINESFQIPVEFLKKEGTNGPEVLP